MKQVNMSAEAVDLIEKGCATGTPTSTCSPAAYSTCLSIRTMGNASPTGTTSPGASRRSYLPAGIRLTLAAAEELHVPMPIARLVQDRLLALQARGDEAAGLLCHCFACGQGCG